MADPDDAEPDAPGQLAMMRLSGELLAFPTAKADKHWRNGPEDCILSFLNAAFVLLQRRDPTRAAPARPEPCLGDAARAAVFRARCAARVLRRPSRRAI